jgi:hypothetical protein
MHCTLNGFQQIKITGLESKQKFDMCGYLRNIELLT